MSLTVTMENQPEIRAWSAPIMGVEDLANDMVMIGVKDRDGNLGAAIGFNAFYGNTASIHVASNNARRWLDKSVLRAVFGYAFIHLKIERLNLYVPPWNKEAQILALKIGGVPEGYMREADGPGQDMVIYGILKRECPWVPAIREMEQADG